MSNQQELLIKHFESRSSISGVEAATIYKIRSLPRRILDLKQLGYQFESQWSTDTTGQRYKRYTLKGVRDVAGHSVSHYTNAE